jgi:hypothetical protein
LLEVKRLLVDTSRIAFLGRILNELCCAPIAVGLTALAGFNNFFAADRRPSPVLLRPIWNGLSPKMPAMDDNGILVIRQFGR